MPRTRQKVAEGIDRINGRSLSARVQVGSGDAALREEKAFDPGTPLKEIQRWREETRVKLRKEVPIIAKGSIEAETKVYLDRAQKRPASVGSKRSEMKAWIAQIGHLRRHQVKPEHVDLAISEWLSDGVAKKTVQNRCRTLHHFYVTMANDKKTHTPLDNVDVPTPEKRRPRDVSPAVIKRTEKRLRSGDPKAHARFMVFATTGIRPSQLNRLERSHIDLRRRLVDISGGKGGEPIIQAVNDEMLVAWKAFIAADAFGDYDSTKFARQLRAAGWPSGIRPYNLKHSIGMHLAEDGAAPGDIQAWFGHTDQKTTRIYTGVPVKRMRRLSEQLDHRFGWAKSPAAVPGKRRTTGQDVAETGAKTRGAKSA
jgi:integrase